MTGPPPFFVEVTQITTMSGTFTPRPSVQVAPSDFFYDRQTGVLLLSSRIDVAWASTDLLIGETLIFQTPALSQENRELRQHPLAQPTLFEVLKFDVKVGILEFVFAGETRLLRSGETLTFKQTGAGPSGATIVTTFANHGRPVDIQVLPPDGSLR